MWPNANPEMARTKDDELHHAAEARRLAEQVHRGRRRTVVVSKRLAGALVALRIADPASKGR
ncbi:MAG: hypothetical protein WD556_08635 [Actinomycetota bacterium]